MNGIFFRQSLAYSLARLAPAVIAIPALAAYTRLLTPVEYGTYITAITVIGLAHSTMLSWLWIVALRLFSGAGKSSTFLTAVLLCYTAILTVAGLCAIVIYAWTLADQLFVFLGFIIFAVVGWLELNMYLLRADLEAGRYLATSLLRAILTMIASVAFAALGLGANGLMIGAILGAGAPALLLTLKVWRKATLAKFDLESLREILRYGLPLGTGFVLEAASVNSDRLVLAALHRAEAMGLYGAAYGLASRTVFSIIDPIGTAGFSLAVRALEEKGSAAATTQLRHSLLLMTAIGFPVVAGLIVVGRDLTALLIGPDFREAAARLLPFLVVSCFLITLRRQYCEVAFHLARKTGTYARTMFVVAIVGVCSSFLLIPRYGSDGAAYAMLITHGLALVLTFCVGSKVFPLPLPMLEMLKLIVATLLMAGIAISIPSGHGLVSLVAKASIGAASYALMLVLFDFSGARSAAFRWIHHRRAPDA